MSSSSPSRALATLGASAMLSFAGCADPLDGTSAPIVNGTQLSASEYPQVFLLFQRSGSSCTGSLISPRVVLTARHCVVRDPEDLTAAPGSDFTVYGGTRIGRFTSSYSVTSARILPGSTGDIASGDAEDIGLLILSSPATETPLTISRERTTSLVGQTITAVGWGTTPEGRGGRKLRTTARVTQIAGGLVFVDPSVCQGDSGGPLIGPDGEVHGVASFIFSPDGTSPPSCGDAPGAYNEIHRYLDWIDGVLSEVGDLCVPTSETCNGQDDDCNGIIDDPCVALGEACTSNDVCTGNLCAETTDGRVCTAPCDPLTPLLGCSVGFHCSAMPGSCDGHCIAGEAGTAAVGTACTDDSECASALCRDPGDGRRRCIEPCELDGASCLAGEVCAALTGACGNCVDETIVRGLAHGFGESCTVGADCRSGLCVDRAGVRECARPLATPCPDGSVAGETACVVDRRQPVGGVCEAHRDCLDGLCVGIGDHFVCSRDCASRTCPDGFSCTAAGSAMVCAPTRALDGDTCTSASDVTATECTSSLCIAAPEGDARVCASACGEEARCAPGFECRRVDGNSVCLAPVSHGCSIARGVGSERSTPSGLAAIVLAMMAGGRVRARRRRSTLAG